MKTRGWMVGALLVLLTLTTSPMAFAQGWCYDVCYSSTSCDWACNNGYMTTCGEWGTCDYHYCNYASICNSNVECRSECYDGEWPNGQWTTCGDAGKPCFDCTPNYQWSSVEVGRWNVVDYFPPNNTPVCTGWHTTQQIGVDANHCFDSEVQYGDCTPSVVVYPRWGDPNCCDDMGYCFGFVWPASCTN